ncbi:MAG: thiamine pyrophosphate-binding protein [Deltaproteobacteria bacterium]|nr:MAG: thiamine pyrophosphate-binding protein [Deltaproteobacteria bacterium]
MDGGSRVAEVLQAHGVRFVFTLCGGHISPILVGCENRGLRVIDVRHEANAVFAADAVSRLTGVPGVAAVTAGPGVTNTITAIKNAQMAQSPLVLLGGATATVLRGRGSLQDIDQMALIKPHVKYAARPNTVREIVPALERAFHEAVSGVPGPVFVELAVDLLYDEEVVREWYVNKTDRPARNLGEAAIKNYLKVHLANQFAFKDFREANPPESADVPTHTDRQVQKAADMLRRAERPVLLVGSQAMLHPRRVHELAAAVEKLNIPVFLSGMARGLLGKDHPLQMRHKRGKALKESDVVVLAGTPMDFRLDYGGHIGRAKVISVNRDADDLTKNRKPELAVLSDPHQFLVDLADIGAQPTRPDWYEAVKGRHDARCAEIDAMADAPVDAHLNPMKVCQSLEKHLTEDSILVVDGGDFVATAAYICQPRKPLSWLDPGVFGTLGVGAGFALGAKLVRPEADVWLVYGDGSAGFTIAEFDTFVRHGVAVNALVGNDAGWTQIARDQVTMLGSDVAVKLRHTDYDVVAKGFGAQGIRMDEDKRIDADFSQALEASRGGEPVLINALIGRTSFRDGSISM